MFCFIINNTPLHYQLSILLAVYMSFHKGILYSEPRGIHGQLCHAQKCDEKIKAKM